jgi:hypothetical protein
MTRTSQRFAALIVAAALAVLVTGCQSPGPIGGPGHEVPANPGAGSVAASSSAVATTTPDLAPLPAGLPADFPVFKGRVLASSKKTSGGKTTYSFTIETRDGAKIVSDWYGSQFQKGGWTVSATYAKAPAGSSSAVTVAKKGLSQATVAAREKSGTTTIEVTLVTSG